MNRNITAGYYMKINLTEQKEKRYDRVLKTTAV